MTEPNIRPYGGQFAVKLASVGNPDHGEDPDSSMDGVPEAWGHVGTLTEARALCEHFITFFNLGGGNWSGGEVVRQSDGLVVGRFSYNGRLWAGKNSDKEICVL